MSTKRDGAGRHGRRLYYSFYLIAGLVLTTAVLLCAGGDAPACFALPLTCLGVSVLTNVEAGKNRFGRYKEYGIPEIVGSAGLVEETETMEEIDGAIERMLARGERLICLNGGDGTVQRALTNIIRRKGEEAGDLPVLFPLRGGTMNLLADHLGIKGTAPELLRTALDIDRRAAELPIVEVPTLRVTRRMAGGTEREYGFFFGNGALYRFHRVYYRETKGGPLAAAGLFAKCALAGAIKRTHYQDVFGLTPARVTIDGFEMPADQVTVVLALVFNIVVITFDAFRDFGEGDFFVIATSVPIFRLARKLHRLLWGKGENPPYAKEEWFNQKASRITMRCREGYSLDGEVFEIDEPYDLTIEAGPRVRFLDLGSDPENRGQTPIFGV